MITLSKSPEKSEIQISSSKTVGVVSYIAKFFLAVLLTGFSLELMFSWAGVGEQETIKLDNTLGFSNFPNKKFTYRKEGFSQLSFNSWGMQDKERSTAKPANTKRIAVIGDSFVASVEVDRSQNFCSLLESALNKQASQMNYEVLNFGVGGYDLGQMYLNLKHRVLEFAPDLVILAYRPESTLLLAPELERGILSARPFFFVGPDGTLIEDRTIQKLVLNQSTAKRMHATSWLRENSRLWGVLGQGIEPVLSWWKAGGFLEAFKTDAHKKRSLIAPEEPKQNAKMQVVEWHNTSQKAGKAIEYLWPVANALILEMNKLCEKNNCKFAILRLPGVRGHISLIENELLEKTTASNNIPYIDTTRLFFQKQRSEKDTYFFVCHMAPKGHAVLAKELSEVLSKKLLPNKQKLNN